MSQTNFEGGTGQRYANPNAMNKRKHKSAARGAEYALLRDAYHGSGGFSDGSYLVRHKREKTEKYNMRKQLSYFLNYMAPIVNSHVDPIFRDRPQRQTDNTGIGGQLWETYLKDTDTNGTTIDRLMKRAALAAKLYEISFIVTDNVSAEALAANPTMDRVIAARALPYSYIVTPDRVVDYRINKFGRLVSFSYTEPSGKTDAKPGEYNIRTWTEKEWTLTDKDGAAIPGAEGSGTHGLGRVPVTPLAARLINPSDLLPAPSFLSIARTNLQIFQICSWLTEIMQNQAFSILIYPSTEETTIEIGTENALGFDPEAKNAPDFIAPPADPAKILADQIDQLVAESYRMGGMAHQTGVKQQASGVAKAYDFERTNQILSDFADNCAGGEKDIADIFGRWVNEDLKYTCSYPDDFGIIDIEQELKDAQAAIDLRLPSSTFMVEIAKKVLAAYMPDLDPEIAKKIIDEIERQGVDKMMSDLTGYDAQDPEGMSDAATMLEEMTATMTDKDQIARARAAIEKARKRKQPDAAAA